MLASAVLAAAAPVALVLVALVLAAVRERRTPCRPRSPFAWRFLQGRPVALVAGSPTSRQPDRRADDCS